MTNFYHQMVALLSRSKTQRAAKLSLQFGLEISYAMNKILEIKMQWNLMDLPVPSQVSVKWELCASKNKILCVLQAHIFILSLKWIQSSVTKVNWNAVNTRNSNSFWWAVLSTTVISDVGLQGVYINYPKWMESHMHVLKEDCADYMWEQTWCKTPHFPVHQ